MTKDAFVRYMLLLNSHGNAGSAYVPKPKFLDSSKDSSLATTESGTCTEPSPALNADVTKNTDVCDNNCVSEKRKDLGSDDAPISVSTENRKHLGCDNVSIRFGTENRKDLDSDIVPLPVSTENRKDLECDVPLTVGLEKNKDLRCDDVPLPVGTQKHNDFECDVTLPVGTEKHNNLECDSPLPVGTEKHKDLGCDDLSTPDVAENRKDLGCDKWNKKSTHICDEELVTKDADWLNTFEPGFQCKVCKNTTHVFPSIYEAIRHIKRTHTHEEYSKFCYRIMVYYKGKEKLCVKRKANTDEFLCPICGLQSQDSLHSHLASMHKGISAKKLGLKDHINRCPHCGKSYSVHRHAQFRRHLLTHTSPVKCKKCNIVLKNKSVYKTHLETHKYVPYTCKECGKVFKNRFGFYQHKKNHQLNAFDERKFRCEICDKAFLYKHHLTNHSGVHSTSRQFECDDCGMTFKLKHHLKNHLEKACPKRK